MKAHPLSIYSPWLHAAVLILPAVTWAAQTPDSGRADRELAEYFRSETTKLADQCLTDVRTLRDWTTRRDDDRRQLAEMLSLAPMPERSDLKSTVTGIVEADSFTVEKIHFQSLPRLYVTANLYVPKGLTKPAPAILYVCGHGPVKTNDISFGNKVAYQHHGIWFARHGYVCLIIDTLQLGEIEGIHHGTHRYGMWWWNSRGYTPAGVEAWNGIRALDYLSTRPEVDTNRFGITGRSGGGAYSWWVAALDDRIKVAAPVAGITDLHNHVVDGVVEGHCDCMFTVNTYRWDYPQVAALIAPRPLLIANSDKDTIFPLDGVVRLHSKVRRIYELYGAADKFGLLITEGPHKDTQDLQVPVFRWFNRFLKGEDPAIEIAATKMFAPHQLRVFNQLPADQVNTRIQERFVPLSTPPIVPQSADDWARLRDRWTAALKDRVFRGWPGDPGPLNLQQHLDVERYGVRLRAFDFLSQAEVPLRLYLVQSKRSRRPEPVVLKVLGEPEWNGWISGLRYAFANELDDRRRLNAVDLTRSQDQHVPEGDPAGFESLQNTLKSSNTALAFIAPRGIGPHAWSGDARKQTQIRRRFMLVGQTLDGMRVWDIRRTIQAVRSIKGLRESPLWLEGRGAMAINALYASLFEDSIAGLELFNLPRLQSDGSDYLNVLNVLDLPQAAAMAAERSQVRIRDSDPNEWDYPMAVASRLNWEKTHFVVNSPGVGSGQ